MTSRPRPIRFGNKQTLNRTFIYTDGSVCTMYIRHIISAIQKNSQRSPINNNNQARPIALRTPNRNQKKLTNATAIHSIVTSFLATNYTTQFIDACFMYSSLWQQWCTMVSPIVPICAMNYKQPLEIKSALSSFVAHCALCTLVDLITSIRVI